jgi:PAS domain S-box-containing protein
LKSAVHDEQIRLLYDNVTLSAGVTATVSSVLCFLQWSVIPHYAVLSWLTYMYLVTLARFWLGWSFRHRDKLRRPHDWGLLFSIGAGLSGGGWGAAALVLYSKDHLTNQVFLAFVLGGMMVGAASVLAARVIDFGLFISLSGFPTALRLLSGGDNVHLAMGSLAALYTVATLITAWRVHWTIMSSLLLRFENQDLLTSLRESVQETEVLNQNLRVEVAERKREAEAREASEKRLALALFGADLGLWDWDIEKGAIFWDEQWAGMLGYKLEELKPMLSTLEALIHPHDQLPRRLAIQELVDGTKPFYESEHRMRTKDGEWKWILSRGKIVVRSAEGSPLRITGTNRDVTERHRIEDALRESHEGLERCIQERTETLALRTRELERSNDDLEQFAYVASHDLKQPLRAVSGFLGVLREHCGGKLDQEAMRYIARALEATERMRELIDDLLAYARVGTRGRDFKNVECANVLDMAIENLAAAIQESGGVVTRDPLPTVKGDALQLVSLFQNLIGNALKFRRETPPRIHVSAERNDRVWRFSIRDNGIGIDPQHYERIFRVFQRLHPRAEYPGTGIGLAISKRIVERHGGRIWVESVPGQGTTFSFCLLDANTN